ncbi:gamma-aminobutyric acid type B receptor subunit 2 isoform X1 [Dermacentor albipictus]|uniref:gamma-aminobutyric acid type B receptor subunit 2 isoform X1 n=2 Tax=Dermacentor albipictus TaxID=60249 RepID=UPI0038FD1BB6
MVVTTRRLRCGALLSCCLLLLVRAGEPSVSYYDVHTVDAVGLNETGPWDVFLNDTTLVLSLDPVNASDADGELLSSSSPSVEQHYDLLPLRNDSAPLLEYREPFPPPSASVEVDRDARKTVYLLGLFELTGSCEAAKGGRAERAAARLAIRHVNERHVVPGHVLEMYDNDTRCDAGAAINAFFHAIYRKQQMTMLLGTSSSEVTERLAKVVSYWGVLQISFGSLSPVLSDRAGFPLFFRTVAPDSSHNPARVALLRRFRWDAVATLHEDDELYALAINELLTQLESANIAVSSSESVTRNDFLEQIQELKNTDSRIIIGSFSRHMARKIFCEVYKQGMYGSDFQWIVQGGLGEWWLDPSGTDCSAAQLRAAADNVITVAAYTGRLPNRASVSGLQMDAFRRELDAELESELRSGLEPALPATAAGYRGHVAQAYDAVWTAALALRSAELLWRKASLNLTVTDFRYEKLLPETGGGDSYGWNVTAEPLPPPQERRMANYFDRIISRLHFNGISGPLSFYGSDRVGITEFQQNQGGFLRKVALYIPDSKTLDFSCIRCRPIIWQDGEPPVARRTVKLSVATIQRSVFISVSVLATFGMLLAIAFLVFNLYYRKSKYIKLSSPKLNNMTVVGCLLVYVAIVVLGLDYGTLGSDTHFAVFCTVRAFLLSGGFSLAFGAIFIKTYRVHHLFVRASSGVIKNKLLQDQQLIALVCVLVLIDCAIVTLWVTCDPMERTMRNLTMQISKLERDVVYLPQREQCHSEHMAKWLGALYIYKGLLLVVGCYMAWETRNVQIPALNDSQYIGMSVYNAVITSALVVALANVISTERYTLTYALVGTLIFVSTTTTLCLLFLPKIHAIMNNADADAVVASSGVRVEFNTRRFAIDERRELYYRTEVQSRAYAREIAQLDAEIARLKRLLGEPLSAEASSENNSVKSESPLSSLLERFKRKRASLENSEAGVAVISRLGAQFPVRSPARVHDLHWRLDEGTRMLQLRAEDLLLPPRHSFQDAPGCRSNDGLQQSRGSLPIIAAASNDETINGQGGSDLQTPTVPHAGSFPTLPHRSRSQTSFNHGERRGSREESIYQSVELAPCSGGSMMTTANTTTTDEYRTLSSDEYRTLSSDDDATYASCRSPAFIAILNQGVSSCQNSPSQYRREVPPLELAVLEEANNDEGVAESSASTTPVTREPAPSADKDSFQTQRELFLKRLEEAESVDV